MSTLRRISVLEGDGDSTDQLVELAVRSIRDGKIVILPTETVYGIAADPARPEMVERVRSWKRRDPDRPFTHHIASREAVGRLAARLPRGVDRLLDRYWPGPLTVVLPGLDAASVGLRWPSHAFTERVITELGTSLYLSSVNESGVPSVADPDAIAEQFGARAELLFDAGPPVLGQDSTVVSCLERDLRVLREGTLSTQDVLETAAELVLFVCTGNTCRSPLAEVIARRTVAEALGVADRDVLAHGLWLSSAGTATLGGFGASEGSQHAAAEIGLDLGGHLTRGFTPRLADRAQRLYCIAESHLEAVRSLGPEIAAKAELLDPGGGIPDPFGGDIEEYRRTRDALKRAVEARRDELVAACR